MPCALQLRGAVKPGAGLRAGGPFLHDALNGSTVLVTPALLAAMAAVFPKGFKEAIGIAVVLVAAYLSLSPVVIGAALLVFPALALGLSGFETGVVVMPLVKGDPGDTEGEPAGRIRNAKKLLTSAALIMSVMLLGDSLVTTLLISAEQLQPGGEANGRALAYLARMPPVSLR